MSRYYSAPVRSNNDWWDRGPLIPNLSVDDHKPVDTGLLDKQGYSIMRVPEPMGFHSPRSKVK